MSDWFRDEGLQKKAAARALEIEGMLAMLRRSEPAVKGVELSETNPVDALAVAALLRAPGQLYTMMPGRLVGHVMIGYRQQFGNDGSFAGMRAAGIAVDSSTPDAERAILMQERAIAAMGSV